MKLDDLLIYDSNAFDPTEWHLYLERGPLLSSMSATLTHGCWGDDGSAHLNFAFTAPQDLTLVGLRCKRAWSVDVNGRSTTAIRTVREEAWATAYQMLAGSQMTFDFIIDPGEWA